MTYLFGASGVITPITFAFASVDVGSGTNYAGGYYMHGATADDFAAGTTHGTVNSAYGAHVYFVQAAGVGGGDTIVQITGTKWDYATGTRSPGASEDVVIDDAGAAGTFYQSEAKWKIGRAHV